MVNASKLGYTEVVECLLSINPMLKDATDDEVSKWAPQPRLHAQSRQTTTAHALHPLLCAAPLTPLPRTYPLLNHENDLEHQGASPLHAPFSSSFPHLLVSYTPDLHLSTCIPDIFTRVYFFFLLPLINIFPFFFCSFPSRYLFPVSRTESQHCRRPKPWKSLRY